MPTKKKESDQSLSSLARQALLAAVEGTSNDTTTVFGQARHRPLMRLFVTDNTSKMIRPGLMMRDQVRLLHSTIGQLEKGTARRFFAGLAEMVNASVETESFVPASALVEDGQEPLVVVPDAQSSEHLQFLQLAAACTKTYIAAQAAQHTSAAPLVLLEEVVQVLDLLHGILFTLNSCGEAADEPQADIVRLCEDCWQANVEGRAQWTICALPLLAFGATEDAKSVKRLYAMREALQLIDFSDASSDSLRDLLLKVVSSPVCLKSTEGPRLLAFLLQTELVQPVHQAIKVQIPEAKASVLTVYAEIYFRAWKEAEAGYRLMVEDVVLSDLVNAVLHVAKPTMHKSLLTILEPFFESKKTPAVEDLLHRLISPILWRTVASPNAGVRVNAASLLAKVFPLQESSHTQTETAVRKATTALQHLLADDDPRVRVAGSAAAAEILSTYWDAVPFAELRGILNQIVTEHSSDATSSAVRAAAVTSVTLLLEAPQSHAVLRPLLPSLGNLIHDKIEKVRLAAVRLLLRVKKMSGIKYYHVVPVDHLTGRLAEEGRYHETSSVASALTALMINSYYPQGPKATAGEQVKRTLTFLSNDPLAAKVFYANMSQHLEVQSVAKLTAMLLRCLQTAVAEDERPDKGRKRRRFVNQTEGDDDDDHDQSTNNILSANDTALMAKLTDTICVLWQSIETQLDKKEHAESRQFLIDAFSGTTLVDSLARFEQMADEYGKDDSEASQMAQEDCYRTCAGILRCAGRLPKQAVEGLVPHISWVLGALEDRSNQAAPKNVTAHIALLCLWDATDEVAQSLAHSIGASFDRDHGITFGSPDSVSRKRQSGRRKKVDKDSLVPKLPPKVALSVLEDILRGPDPSSVAARESILGSATACRTIESMLERGSKSAETILSSHGDEAFLQSEMEYVLRVCEAYGRFTLHKEASLNAGINFSAEAKKLLHWTTGVVLPVLLPSSATVEKVPFSDPNLSHISVEKSFESFPVSPIVGPPRRRANRNTTPVRLDGAGLSSFGNDTTLGSTEPALARALAVSLMQSCVMIFAEWIAVGGAGAEEIAKASVEWTQLFDNNEDGEDGHNLLPGFCRLAMQLCKSAENFSLLKSLLAKAQEDADPDATGPIRSMLTSLLPKRSDTSSVAERTVQCVVEAAHEIIGSKSLTFSTACPASIGQLWPHEGNCIVSALRAVLANKQATLVLAEMLAAQVGAETGDLAQESSQMLFDAKCLCLLCDAEANTKSSAEVMLLVRRIDLGSLGETSTIRPLMEELLDITG